MQITIREVRTIGGSKGREDKKDKLVLYQVDDHPPRVLRMPAETFTEQTLKDAIAKEIREHKELQGKTWQL